jgi:hypothetical protein
MSRLAFVAQLSSLLLLSAQSVFACGGTCRFYWGANPQTGTAPVSVWVSGESNNFGALKLDMGGEGLVSPVMEPYFNGSPCDGDGFHAEHRFFCPGTYTIQLFDSAHPTEVHTTTVEVLPPPHYYLFAFAGDNEHEAYIATHVNTSQRNFVYSTVDWGDGSSETFTYALRGSYAGTPNHSYAADGEYTATIKHHYEGQYCSWDQTETILVKIPVVSLATNPSTWGHVKSMYR